MSNRQLAAIMPPWSAPARLLPPVRAALHPLSVNRNLILVNLPGWQEVSDWHTIASHVRDFDPRIEVFVVNGRLRNSYTRKTAARRPTLVCSPSPIPTFAPARGRVYRGRQVPKLEQLRLLAAAGVPVPRTATLTPDLRLDPTVWGEFVIVKPTDLATSSKGTGIELMRTHRVRYKLPAAYPEDHPGRRGPMVVQQFINTGRFVSAFRVLTFFGEPLYSTNLRSNEPRIDLSASDEEIERVAIATQALANRESHFVVDDEVLALARRAHEAIPDVPLKGCDVIRDEGTGALYVLELNPGGNTWYFSSATYAARRAARGPERERQRRMQFDAFRTAARVLAERTNAEAE